MKTQEQYKKIYEACLEQAIEKAEGMADYHINLDTIEVEIENQSYWYTLQARAPKSPNVIDPRDAEPNPPIIVDFFEVVFYDEETDREYRLDIHGDAYIICDMFPRLAEIFKPLYK
jgi:hypothetical protein